MTHINFIGGEKGGVGKSLLARVLAQYFIDHQQTFLGFDSDKSHGALLRFYADYTAPVTVDRYESLDRIIEAANSDRERRYGNDESFLVHRALPRASANGLPTRPSMVATATWKFCWASCSRSRACATLACESSTSSSE